MLTETCSSEVIIGWQHANIIVVYKPYPYHCECGYRGNRIITLLTDNEQ